MEINDTELLLGWVSLAGIVAIAVLIFRIVIKHRSTHISKLKSETSLSSRTKYPEVDSSRFAGQISLLSIAIALAFSLITISWTRYDKPVYSSSIASLSDDFVEIIPKTSFPQRPLPPIPLAKVQEIVEVENNAPGPEFIEIPLQADSSVLIAEPVESSMTFTLPDPPPLVDLDEDLEGVWVTAEHMPRFPGCESLDVTNAEKLKCAEMKLLEYIHSQINYPAMARENRIEGNVVAQFVVEKDGSISGIKIVRDVGGGCGEAVYKAVASMNDMGDSWIPGKQRGRAVRVRFTLPITFKLN